MKKETNQKNKLGNKKTSSSIVTPARVVLVGILLTLVVLVIKSNIDNTRITKATSSVVINKAQTNATSTIPKDNIQSLVNIEVNMTDVVSGSLNEKGLFTLYDKLPEGVLLDKPMDNVLYFLVDNNHLKNKGQYVEVTNIEEIDSVFYIRYEYTNPQIGKVIGEKTIKDGQVLLFPTNRLHNGVNKFVFTEKSTNLGAATLEYTVSNDAVEKISAKIINPLVSPNGKKIAYMGNKKFKWNIYIYDVETKETITSKNPEYFNDITDQNDNVYDFSKFPKYAWGGENELIVTNIHEIYKIDTRTGVNSFITNDDKSSQEIDVQYDKNSRGVYYIETYNLEQASIMYVQINRYAKRKVVGEKDGIIRSMSVSPDGDKIAYTVFNSEAPTYKYKLNVYTKTDNKITELYQGNKIENVCWQDNENIYFTNSVSLGSDVNNIYSIKANKTNYRTITQTSDKHYDNLKNSNGNIYFLIKNDLYGTLWNIDGDSIKKVLDNKIVADYSVFNALGEVVFVGDDYSIYKYSGSNGLCVKIVSSVIGEGVVKGE